MYFPQNIKMLRKRRKRTQDDVAVTLNMKRSTLSGYENGVAEPGLDSLISLSKYYGISIDTLVNTNLEKLSESQLSELERGFDVYIKGSSLRVLACTVDSSNNENIELVNEKASAGYSRGYSDPEYISVLPVFQLPFLSKSKKYRTFQISGDSMLPIPHGAYVTGEYIQNWSYLKKGDTCIIVTHDDGVVFKILGNTIAYKTPVTLRSLNPQYKTYQIDSENIKEIWKFVNYISSDVPEAVNSEMEIFRTMANLKDDVEQLKKKLNS
ncbi:MAG: LexA family transcriptional regulator [Bacteroidales bacterium]|nr:LexA family transcriptional regulator [Bacteroidales bacterium]